MDKGDKNIEQFFNKSLAQFKDAPSDQVWERLSQQMGDEPPTFFQRFKNWIIAGTLLSLFAFSIWGYFTLSHKIQLLVDQTIVLAIENSKLQNQLSTCQNTTTSIQQKLQTIKDTNTLKETAIGSTDKAEESFKAMRKASLIVSSPAFTNRYSGKKSPTVFSNDYDVTRNPSNPPYRSLLFNEEERPSIASYLFNKEEGLNNTSSVATKSASDKQPKTQEQSYITPLLRISQNKQWAVNSLKKSGLSSGLGWDFSAPPIKPMVKYRPEFRFGIDATAYMVFTDQEDNFTFSQRFGIANELQLYNNVFLTAGIGFRFEDYAIDVTPNNQHILTQYPSSPESANPAFEIQQEVRILDAPFGIKWYSDLKENGNRYFVHPSVAWQFYFPQKFKYFQEDGIPLSFASNNQYFGYLGTAQLQIGLEKKVGKKWNMQWGLWGEKSLLPMGIEDRSLFSFGIRGAVYLR